MREPTVEEAFVLRTAARIIHRTSLREDFPETAGRLDEAAELHDAPFMCEACDAPTRFRGGDDDIPLCGACESESAP